MLIRIGLSKDLVLKGGKTSEIIVFLVFGHFWTISVIFISHGRKFLNFPDRFKVLISQYSHLHGPFSQRIWNCDVKTHPLNYPGALNRALSIEN
jgi:hypothetical protein